MSKEYIEREALIRCAEKQEVIIKDGTSIAEAMRIQGNVFRRCVETCPAADVVEVVHGYWIDKCTGAYGRMQSWCSACGKHSGIGGIESNRHKPYCPNCGAKMDGERKEV
jgi:hypothetical protein